MQIETRENQLLKEVERLREEMEKLQQTNRDLQIALSTTAEHGHLIEAQLYKTDKQLQAEVEERKRAESSLTALINLVSKQNHDPEAIVQTIKEYSQRLSSQSHKAIDGISAVTSVTDSLTQLASRYRFNEYLEQQWKQMAKHGSALSIVLCRINNFQQFHNAHGCPIGHACLKQIVEAFDRTVKRSADLTARYGEAELAAILPKTSVNGALIVAEQIQASVAELQMPQTQSGSRSFPTLSISIVGTTPDVGRSPRILIDEADRLLQLAKQDSSHQILHASLD